MTGLAPREFRIFQSATPLKWSQPTARSHSLSLKQYFLLSFEMVRTVASAR